MENEVKIMNNQDSKFIKSIKEFKDKTLFKKVPDKNLFFNNIYSPPLPPINFNSNDKNYSLLINDNKSRNQLNFNNEYLPDLFQIKNPYNLNDFNNLFLSENNKKLKEPKILDYSNTKEKHSKINIKEIKELKANIKLLEQKSNKLEYVNNILFQMIKIKNYNKASNHKDLLFSNNRSCENINTPSKSYLNHNYYPFNDDNFTNIKNKYYKLYNEEKLNLLQIPNSKIESFSMVKNNIINLNKKYMPQNFDYFNYSGKKGKNRFYQLEQNIENKNNFFDIENEKNMENDIIDMINKVSMNLNKRLLFIEKSQELQKNQIENIIKYNKNILPNTDIENKINKKNSINKESSSKISNKCSSCDKAIKKENKKKQKQKNLLKKNSQQSIKNKKEISKSEISKQNESGEKKSSMDKLKKESSKKEKLKKETCKKETPKKNISQKEILNKQISNESNIKSDEESEEKSNKKIDVEKKEKEENCPPPIANIKRKKKKEETDLKSFSSLELTSSDEA